MTILAIGGLFHDLNAAAFNPHTSRMATGEEERFSRKKHHSVWHQTSTSLGCVEFVLRDVGSDADAVSDLVFSDLMEHPIKGFIASRFPNARVHVLEHHLCHAAAAFHSSGFDKAAILSLDGFGDDASGMLAVGDGKRVTCLRRLPIVHSIGLEFLRVTHNIGLGSFGAEGKTQGLAAYGEPRFLEDYLKETTLRPDGLFEFSPAIQSMERYNQGEIYMETKHLFNDFIQRRIRRRFPMEPMAQEHKDLAASVQELLNRIALHAAKALRDETGFENLVVTGGVALNSTMNGILLKSGLFSNVYAHPCASDRGNALGALLHHVKTTSDHVVDGTMRTVYAGQAFTRDDILAACAERGVACTVLDDPAEVAAGFLAEGKFIGWFQGRSEAGARALGNRSILADPRGATVKDDLNAKVKHREWFRPFAPSVLERVAHEYFDVGGHHLPFMTFTVPVLPEKHPIVPAITHVDGTARIQTVRESENQRYHQLIEAFGRKTGVPMVLNTSFNDNDEPIVETPLDALNCLSKTGLDALIMEDVLVLKS